MKLQKITGCLLATTLAFSLTGCNKTEDATDPITHQNDFKII